MIQDLPRPWLLAAMTGVPMSDLLRVAEQEPEQPENVRLEDYRQPAAGRLTVLSVARRREMLRLAS